MKKFLAILTAVLMLASLSACGETAPTPEVDTPEVDTPEATDATVGEESAPEESDDMNPLTSAVDAIARVWNAYSEDDRFMTFGGDYNEENQVENAPGVHNIETEDDAAMLNDAVGFPSEMIDKIAMAAVMRHMLNVNTFTCGAYAVKSADDLDAVCEGIRDSLMNRSYLCGWPEVLFVMKLPNNFVMNVYGARDLVEKFVDTAKEVYGDALEVYCEEDMSEAGGDNTFRIAVPHLGGISAADSDIGGFDEAPEEGDSLPGGSLMPLGSVPPENEYLRDYFDDMEQLLGGWRDEGKFGINKLGFDLTLPRIDIVTATESDAEALKNELISMGDYSEKIPYYNEDVIRITIGEHFPDDMR